MKRWNHYLITLLACLAGVTGQAMAETTLFTATYRGEYSGFDVVTTRKLIRQDDGQYLLYSLAQATLASIKEESLFTLEPVEGHPLPVIVPQSYEYHRKVFGVSKRESIDFDWQEKQASYQRKGKPEKDRTHDIHKGMLDLTLYQLQLQRDLQLGKTEFDYTFVKKHKIKTMVFTLDGEDSLEVGDKIYRATRLKHTDPEDNKETLVWFIPELDYQLGKILHTDEDGDSYQISLSDYNGSDQLYNKIYPEK